MSKAKKENGKSGRQSDRVRVSASIHGCLMDLFAA